MLLNTTQAHCEPRLRCGCLVQLIVVCRWLSCVVTPVDLQAVHTRSFVAQSQAQCPLHMGLGMVPCSLVSL